MCFLRIEMAVTRKSNSRNSCCNVPHINLILNNGKKETIFVENPIQISRLINKLAKQKKQATLEGVVKTEPFAVKFYNQILPLVIILLKKTDTSISCSIFLCPLNDSGRTISTQNK